MSAGRIVELAVAAALIAAAVYFYRKRDKSDSYGSQGAVLLLVIGAITAVHALGLLEYRPSDGELEMIRGPAQ